MGLIDKYSQSVESVDTPLNTKVNPIQLEWEPIKYDKYLSFDESLERLHEAGYQRHPRPNEVFSLICDHLEGNLNGYLDAVAQDMFPGRGEWLSMAFECKGNTLVCYTDPENLRWDGKRDRYVVDGAYLKHSGERVFDISGIPCEEWVDLEKFNPEFTQAMYSREFSALPKEIREGDLRARVWPPEQGIWPVRGDGDCDRFSINYYFNGASRGVRRVRK